MSVTHNGLVIDQEAHRGLPFLAYGCGFSHFTSKGLCLHFNVFGTVL